MLKIAAASDEMKPNGDDQLRQAILGVVGSVISILGSMLGGVGQSGGITSASAVQCSGGSNPASGEYGQSAGGGPGSAEQQRTALRNL